MIEWLPNAGNFGKLLAGIGASAIFLHISFYLYKRATTLIEKKEEFKPKQSDPSFIRGGRLAFTNRNPCSRDDDLKEFFVFNVKTKVLFKWYGSNWEPM